MRRRLPLILLLAILAVSFGCHAYFAANPTTSYQSADESSYGRLAIGIADHGYYGDPRGRMRDPLHWPPGAPALFAAAHKLAPDADSERTRDIPAAYWAQAIVSVGTTLGAFGFAWALAGWWAGLLAAALVGFYPPLILASGEQISEPFGAFLFTSALSVLALSARRRFLPGYFVAGGLLGATVLTRADLLLAPFLVAGLLAAWVWFARREGRRALAVGGLVLAGSVVAIAPWTYVASKRAKQFVPVTQGSAAAFFVGTYLPGNGTTVGMKRALAPVVYAKRPESRKTPAFELQAGYVLEVAVASRHPELPSKEAISKEGRENLRRYALGDPLDFGLMMLNKVQRMWTRYARGGARHTSWVIRAWHIALVGAGFAGLVLGAWRRREALIAAVAFVALYSTALHTLVVSQARYNLPLMPLVIAGGVAGWWLWLRARREPGAEEEEAQPPDPVERALHAPPAA